MRAAGREALQAIELDALPSGSVLAALDPPPGWQGELSVQDVCPVLPLAMDLERTLPRRMLEKLRYYRRRADGAGCAITAPDAQELPRFLAALFDLHTRRWRTRGGAGVLADRRVRRFHEEVAPALHARGLLRAFALQRGDAYLGAYYGFAGTREHAFYLHGFDPAAAGLSPGTLLIGHAIATAAREGARAFNFLRGAEPYKYA